MNEGMVPPRLAGGVTDALDAYVEGDAKGINLGGVEVAISVDENDGLAVVARGIEDGAGRVSEEGGVIRPEGGGAETTTLGMSATMGRPKLKGTASPSSSPSSSKKLNEATDFLMGEDER